MRKMAHVLPGNVIDAIVLNNDIRLIGKEFVDSLEPVIRFCPAYAQIDDFNALIGESLVEHVV